MSSPFEPFAGRSTFVEVSAKGCQWSGDLGGKSGEVWDPATSAWRTLSGVPADPILTRSDPEGSCSRSTPPARPSIAATASVA